MFGPSLSMSEAWAIRYSVRSTGIDDDGLRASGSVQDGHLHAELIFWAQALC